MMSLILIGFSIGPCLLIWFAVEVLAGSDVLLPVCFNLFS